MQRHIPKISLITAATTLSLWIAARSLAQNGANAPRANADGTPLQRPQYRINAAIDYDVLSLKSTAEVTVPVAPGDILQDVVFFLFANAGGVGGDDPRHKNLVVDSVSLHGAAVPFTLDGAVLRARLPQAMSNPFTLKIDYHGVVPRSPAGSSGLADMMGGLSGDLGDVGGLLGGLGGDGAAGGAAPTPKKAANVDYGLYTYGNGVLSLGAFWYPSLAVRKNGRWVDEAPQGLGDVAYADMSDYDVSLAVPATVQVAAPGHNISSKRIYAHYIAQDVRDFSVLMSEDYVIRAKTFDVGGKPVRVVAYTVKTDTAKADGAVDIAGHALQIYSRRFGAYPYDEFKVVEGPIRGGAGGMEFSGQTSIASMLYQDMGKQLEGLAGALGAGGLDKVMGGLGLDDEGGAQPGQAAPAEPATPENPAGDMLKGLLGQQKELLDSMFEVTIAHEVAHQWWAIGVGSDSQRDPFVDESLANYSAMLYFEDRYGPEKAQKMIDVNLKTTYQMGRMLGNPDAPANLRTSAYKNNIQYGGVVYGKGALYYDALRHAVGDPIFFASLREYYATYRDHLAGPRALLNIVARRAPNAHVDTLYQHWIEQAHGDADIAGGKVMNVNDMLGGLLGGGNLGDQ